MLPVSPTRTGRASSRVRALLTLVAAASPSLLWAQSAVRGQVGTSPAGGASSALPSGNDARPVAEAAARRGSIAIDGRLDEAAWNAATPITGFLQQAPDEGKSPTQRTELRFLFDASALYVGARMYDTE